VCRIADVIDIEHLVDVGTSRRTARELQIRGARLQVASKDRRWLAEQVPDDHSRVPGELVDGQVLVATAKRPFAG
jgi:hypothetical protein